MSSLVIPEPVSARASRPPHRARRRALLPSLISLSALALGCATPPASDDLPDLVDELQANDAALAATADSLRRHVSLSIYFLRWMDGVEDAGSANLWDAMRILSTRPAAPLMRSTFDDLVMTDRLVDVVPDDEARRALIALHDTSRHLSDAAEPEYRALIEHYEATLGPGEWRNLLGVEIGEEDVFSIDYRKSLADLVGDNHAAVLRSLLRAQTMYLARVEAAAEQTRELVAVLSDAR
jgi:hypothetical protein